MRDYIRNKIVAPLRTPDTIGRWKMKSSVLDGAVLCLMAVGLVVGPTHPALADDMTSKQVMDTLTKNNLSSLIPLYEKGILKLDTKNTTVNSMKLIRGDAAYQDSDAAHATYWYRGMGVDETNALIANNMERLTWGPDDFLGIAPEFTYSKGYLSNKNPGTVVEFGTDASGWLYTQWSRNHPCQIKAEGGGTYGLGPKGTVTSCNNGPTAYRPPIATLGDVFNPWLANNTVTSKIVYVQATR